MRVLVACEFSGVVRDAFAARGHDSWSCDLLPTERPGQHIQGDVREVLGDGWDLMVAHPPCTHLSKAGAWCWKRKPVEQAEALDFVRALLDAPIGRIAVENPVGKINSAIGPPAQIIHPWQFGDPWTKETCLWLRNLPALVVEAPLFGVTGNRVAPTGNWVKPGNHRPWRRFSGVPEGGKGNAKDRSRTFPGIALAMAEQWGALAAQEQIEGAAQ